jgi:outer membrane protein OmpA-like peptidoglycan-associated protein
MGTSKIFYILMALALMSSCGLNKMADKYETVSFTTSPPTLQAHAGKVALSLNATFGEKYFAKNATVDFTPVLIYNGGEKAFKTITIQGEEATGGEATIFHLTGGSFKYQDAISYSEQMISSTLELRAVARLKDKEKALGPINIANGVIATSTRVQDTEDLANNNHGYEHETILEEAATIYFLVNQSNIRATEKSADDIKKLKSFAKNGYKTNSFTIISYASPEGTVNTNDNVSEKRMKSTVNYTKNLLRSLKIDGAKKPRLIY